MSDCRRASWECLRGGLSLHREIAVLPRTHTLFVHCAGPPCVLTLSVLPATSSCAWQVHRRHHHRSHRAWSLTPLLRCSRRGRHPLQDSRVSPFLGRGCWLLWLLLQRILCEVTLCCGRNSVLFVFGTLTRLQKALRGFFFFLKTLILMTMIMIIMMVVVLLLMLLNSGCCVQS